TTAVLHQPAAPPIKLERDKVYYSMVRTDGDNVRYLRRYYRDLYDDPAHGQLPLAWQVTPMSVDLMPNILDYYYRNATPKDYFVNSLTGMTYIHENAYATRYPLAQQQRILREYVELTSSYMKKIDANIMATFGEMSAERMQQFAKITNLRALFAN